MKTMLMLVVAIGCLGLFAGDNNSKKTANAGPVKSYTVKKISHPADIGAAWDSADWKDVEALKVDNFRPEGSKDHHPEVECRLQHDATGLYGLFQVKDKYIRSVYTGHNNKVCRDSCVEFLVEPPGGQGYFNFEMSCGGSMLLFHIKDPSRSPTGKSFKDFTPISEDDAKVIKIFHTMPRIVEPELVGDQTWRVGFYIPFSFFESRIKGLKAASGQTWRGNFYKCGDQTSHPHWASWSPIPAVKFHLPAYFGNIILE